MPPAIDLTSDLRGTGPLLIFGGPYSNLRATQAIRAEAQRLGIPGHRTICTGDVVAYCAEPQETCALVRDWGCHVVAGNCEEQLAAGALDCGCGFEEGTACDLLAKGWYPYADRRIEAGTREWMRTLPQAITFRFGGLSFRVVHGGVDVINRFIFASENTVIADELERAGVDVVIAGHSGIPFVHRSRSGKPAVWFNPGVIGMPANDGTADAWYGLVEPLGLGVRLSLYRLPYDHMGAASAVRRQGYADSYARALVTGLWPSLDVLPPKERSQSGKRLRMRSMTVLPPDAASQDAAE